jgi:uncharacterized protein involved in exopolysaccharide biosynthesis/Mrp family chromosome partitioning ATPase
MPSQQPLSRLARGRASGRDLLDPVNERLLLREIFAFFRRRAGIIAAAVLSAVGIGAVYTELTRPVYVAQAQIVLDLGPNSVLHPGRPADGVTLESVQVENQVAVLGSERIIDKVVKELGLARDPELGYIGPSPEEGSGEKTQSGEPPLDPKRQREIIDAFQRRLQVRRVGMSSAISILYRSESPIKAARIANGVVDAYLGDQTIRRAEIKNQGNQWLKDRVEELRHKMNEAMQEVQAVRAKRDYRLPQTADADKSDEATLEDLEVRGATYRKMYESYMQAYFGTVYEQSFLMPSVEVVSRATAPVDTVHPRAHLILPLTALAGLLVGTGIAFVRDTLETAIRHGSQISDLGIVFLGEMPALPRLRQVRQGFFGRKSHRAGSGQADDSAADVARPQASLALQVVKSRLPLTGERRTLQPLIVTSVLPSEGKTTLARGLATAYAASGVRTLLVDANVGNPTLTRHRQVLDGDGFLELLAEPEGLQARILQGGAWEADFLPVGRSADGLARLRDPLGGWQEALTRQLLAVYDVVILDTAALSDPGTVALASPGGGAIVVCSYGEATKTSLEEAVGILTERPVTVLGAVINRSPRKPSPQRSSA